jgi:uncharacterized membrane protein
MKNHINKLDKNALKFNQGSIVVLLALAFIFDLPWLVALVMAIMLVGTILPYAGLFKLFYLHIVKPLGIINPKIVDEDNSPHQFAQGLGGIFLLASYLFLVLNFIAVGWIFTLIVMALAFINLTLNFCLGCYVYFQLHKLGILRPN